MTLPKSVERLTDMANCYHMAINGIVLATAIGDSWFWYLLAAYVINATVIIMLVASRPDGNRDDMLAVYILYNVNALYLTGPLHFILGVVLSSHVGDFYGWRRVVAVACMAGSLAVMHIGVFVAIPIPFAVKMHVPNLLMTWVRYIRGVVNPQYYWCCIRPSRYDLHAIGFSHDAVDYIDRAITGRAAVAPLPQVV